MQESPGRNDFYGALIPAARVCLMSVAMIVSAGCRSDDNFSRILDEPMPLPVDIRAGFGKVALLPDDSAAELDFAKLESLKSPGPPWAVKTFDRLEAATRIDDDFEDRELGDPMNYYDLGRGVGILVIAGGAALAEGIFSSVPQAELDASRAAVTVALEEMPLQTGITAAIRKLASVRNEPTLTEVPAARLPALNLQIPGNRNFSALTNDGIDTVLVVRVARQQFGVVRKLDPPIVFAVKLEVYLFRTRDGSVEYFRTLNYQSEERKFTDWGSDNARHFRAELERAQQQLAEAVLTLLLGDGP